MPSGRPKGSTNKKKQPVAKGEGRSVPKKQLVLDNVPRIAKNSIGICSPCKHLNVDERYYYCCSCGKKYTNQSGNFPASQSIFFVGNNGHLPICRTCMAFFEVEYTRELGSSDEGLRRLAAHWDYYVSDEIISASRKVNQNQPRITTLVSKNFGMGQFAGKTYDTYLEEFEENILFANKLEEISDSNISNNNDVVWTDGDIKNKKYVIQTVGYDCFEDINYTEENKKFLYNTLADYLTDEVLEDQHKLQSAIAMVKDILQRENITRLINAEIRKQTLNYSLIEQLGKIKSNLVADINKTANENGISAKTSGKNSKGSNTLTNITKEMIENNFDDAKVNIVDIKLSEAYKNVAEKNAQALIAELNYQSDDYARMLSESRVFNESLQDKITELEEENRKLKVEIKTLKVGDS